jgi:hypothetical protein
MKTQIESQRDELIELSTTKAVRDQAQAKADRINKEIPNVRATVNQDLTITLETLRAIDVLQPPKIKARHVIGWEDILYCIAGAGLVILGFLLATGKI